MKPVTVAQALPDHASLPDQRGIPIERVGISGLRYPIVVLDRERNEQSTLADIRLAVHLPAEAKGTHMSRFVEVLEEVRGRVGIRTLPEIVNRLKSRLGATEVDLAFVFPYSLSKSAPVTGAASFMVYQCRFEAASSGNQVDFRLGARVPVKALCPCSKAISDRGAHNQRSVLDVRLGSDKFVWLEDLIHRVESCGSAPVYALLKREDEKFVTEQAYDNPKFVEDLVRDVIVAVRAIPGVFSVAVHAENQESIHDHAAFAEARWER